MRKIGQSKQGNTPAIAVRITLEDRQYLIAQGSTLSVGLRKVIEDHKQLNDKLKELAR